MSRKHGLLRTCALEIRLTEILFYNRFVVSTRKGFQFGDLTIL